MGTVFPLSVLLTAAEWITVSAGIVISWFIHAGRKFVVWRTCLYLSVAFAILPIFLSIAGLIDAFYSGYWSVWPVVLFIIAVSAPGLSAFLYFQKGVIKYGAGKL